MWICDVNGFVSAVQDVTQADVMMVRARKKEHLERLFPRQDVLEWPSRDYAYRVRMPRTEFKTVMADRIDRITYPNFKNAVLDPGLHDLYADFWDLHWRYQKDQERL